MPFVIFVDLQNHDLLRQGLHQWLRKHEPGPDDTPISTVVAILLVSPIILAVLYTSQYSWAYSILFSCAIFYLSLSSSIFIYRISPFHALANIPGPFPAKLSKFWLMYISLKGGKSHQYLQKLHQKYGPIVRIGESREFEKFDKCDL